MDSSTLCPTRLISDVPSEQDNLFEGGSGPHQRVALAISNMIQSESEQGGKVIGLQGGWGSGKSTVVKILASLLKSNENITDFHFDAWAHEGDPLRRTFLESLIKHFQTIGWLNKKNWDNVLIELSRRKRTIKTRSTPTTTTLARIFAIALLFVPIGSPLLFTALRDGVIIDFSAPFSIQFIFGITLTSLPLLVLAGNQIRIWSKRGLNDIERAEAWAFLTGNATTEILQNSTESLEPTSIEFEDCFRRLMNESLTQHSERRCLIVLDNLDRIESKFALAIWSTLQTFLQDRNTDKEQWYKKLWLLVPYDQEGIHRLWTNMSRLTPRNVEHDQESTNSSGSQGSAFVADSFLDKSFQIRFEVTPLVLSNWKSYLINLLKQALPAHSEDATVHNEIFSVYNLSRKDPSRSPTPRELKLFVNQIGSLHRQWEHKFPLSHISYYSLLKRQSIDINRELLDGGIPDKTIESMLGPELQGNLAGLLFNVENNIGQQFLLKDPIVNALSSNRQAELTKYKEKHGQGFWVVLGVIFDSEFASFDISTLANSATCLQGSEVLKDGDIFIIRQVKERLRKTALEKKRWGQLDHTITQGIASTCHLISSEDFTSELLGNVRSTVAELKFDSESLANNTEQVQGIMSICKACIALGHQKALSEPIILPTSEAEWIQHSPAIYKEESLWAFLKPRISFEDIMNHISDAVSSGTFSEKFEQAIRVSDVAFKGGVDWEPLTSQIVARLGQNKIPVAEIGHLMNALYLLKQLQPEPSTKALQSIVASGDVTHQLFQLTQSDGDDETRALCLLSYLQFRPDMSAPANKGNSAQGYNQLSNSLGINDPVLASLLVRLANEHKMFDVFMNVVTARNSYDQLLIGCLRNIAQRDDSPTWFTADQIIENWSGLKANLDHDDVPNLFYQLLNQLCKRAKFIDSLLARTFNLDDSLLYLAILDVSDDQRLNSWCVEGFESLTYEQWISQLEPPKDSLQLLIKMINKKLQPPMRLTTAFEDSLLWHAKETITGNIGLLDDSYRSIWLQLPSAMESTYRDIFPGRVLREAMDANGHIKDQFFVVYGDMISGIESLSGNPSVVERLFSPIVIEKSLGGLRWLLTLLRKHNNLLDHFSNEKKHVQYFKARLKESIKQTSEDDVADAINQLADIVGLLPDDKDQQ